MNEPAPASPPIVDLRATNPVSAEELSEAVRSSLQALAARAAALDDLQAVALLREDQFQRWQCGKFLPAEAYLAQMLLLRNNEEMAVDLVYSEILLREQGGERPVLDEYLRRFPQYEVPLRLQFAMHSGLGADVLAAPPALDREALDAETQSYRPAEVPSAQATRLGTVEWPHIPGYEILAVLGRGGMGMVYKAQHVRLKRLVALKVLRAGTHADPAELARFRKEAEAVARLQHPNIVQIYDIGEWRSGHATLVPFLSLEFVEGGNLHDRLAGSRQPPRTTAQMVEVLARAMHVAHQNGVVHRDLKPANVLLAGAPNLPLAQCVPKISDFGLAKQLDDDSGQTITGIIVGTPSHMAPEQAAGQAKQIGPLADIYALGTIIYEMLTGRPVFKGLTVWSTLEQVRYNDPIPPRRLVDKVPVDLETICLKCLEKAPGRRYPSALALADDLRAYLAGEPIQARPLRARERAVRWLRHHPGTTLLLALAAVAAAAFLAGSIWYNVLTFSLVAVLSVLTGGGWYYLRLRTAVRDLARQHLLAERQVERLHLLLEMTNQLVSATDLAALLRLIGETTTRLVNAERATIFLIDRASNELWSKVALGEGMGEIRVPLGTGIAGLVAANGETIHIADAYADPRFNQDVDRQTGYRTRNVLAIAMQAQPGRLVGVLEMLNKRGGEFLPEDTELLTALATTAAVAVEHARRSEEHLG